MTYRDGIVRKNPPPRCAPAAALAERGSSFESAREGSRRSNLNVGDRVWLPRVGHGTVVGLIERGEYAAGLKPDGWNSLRKGVLVQLADGMLCHIREPEFVLQRVRAGPVD